MTYFCTEWKKKNTAVAQVNFVFTGEHFESVTMTGDRDYTYNIWITIYLVILEEPYQILLFFIWWKSECSYFDISWDIVWHCSRYEHGNKQPRVARDSGNESTHFWHSPMLKIRKSCVFLPPTSSCGKSTLIITYVSQVKKIIKFSFVRMTAATAITSGAAWDTDWTGNCSFAAPQWAVLLSSPLFFVHLKQQIWHRLIWLLTRLCENQMSCHPVEVFTSSPGRWTSD